MDDSFSFCHMIEGVPLPGYAQLKYNPDGSRQNKGLRIHSGQATEQDRHNPATPHAILIDNGAGKEKSRRKYIVACNHGILIREEKCERQQKPDRERKGSIPQENINSREACNPGYDVDACIRNAKPDAE